MANTVSRIISDETLSCLIQIESAGRPAAKARTSSATGLAQFIDATWLAVVAKHRPAWGNGKSASQLLALRTDPQKSIEMLARFTEDNAAILGAGYTPGDLYLAHFAGVGAARQLIRSDQALPASKVFSPAAIAANRSILQGKTIGQVRIWAERKMRSARGRNWVAVFMVGAKPAPAPVVKATAKAASVALTTTAAAGASSGWSAGAIVLALAACAALVLGIGVAVHLRARTKLVQLEAV